jgi:peroxiredoxin family protein
MKREMEKLDVPPVGEFLEMMSDAGVELYACKMTVDMYGLTIDDFVPQVNGIMTVGEFYEKSAGAQIIFT